MLKLMCSVSQRKKAPGAQKKKKKKAQAAVGGKKKGKGKGKDTEDDDAWCDSHAPLSRSRTVVDGPLLTCLSPP
jgi:hypothetical protein